MTTPAAAQVTSLLINIPPLEPESLVAAGALLPLVAGTGVELTLVQVEEGKFAASCLIPPSTSPIAVTGASRAECLTKLVAILVPTPVLPSVPG
jgi:H+/gluconate symporter-like permease